MLMNNRMIWILLVLAHPLLAEIMPAPLFRDGAVLQRDKPVPVWGRAEAGAKVRVAFAGQTQSTTADARGRWRVSHHEPNIQFNFQPGRTDHSPISFPDWKIGCLQIFRKHVANPQHLRLLGKGVDHMVRLGLPVMPGILRGPFRPESQAV